jgi:hypothetical protein
VTERDRTEISTSEDSERNGPMGRSSRQVHQRLGVFVDGALVILVLPSRGTSNAAETPPERNPGVRRAAVEVLEAARPDHLVGSKSNRR